MTRYIWVLFACLVALTPSAAQTKTALPSILSDREFWSLIERISEPDGFFRSNSGSTDNLLSNESELSVVAEELTRRVKPSGVYLGVGPEQNFTYIAATKPRMAVITDIRRGNLELHLLYKAIFEISANRADFVSLLFSRKSPQGLTSALSAGQLMNAYMRVPAGDEATYQANLKAIIGHLTKTRAFPLDADDIKGIEYVYASFHKFGPGIFYTATSTRTTGVSYASLMSTADSTGKERSYLANEANYGFVKGMEQNNMIVPIVGDFAGPKALRGVGRYLNDHGASVAAFYVSNVEMYLEQNGVWQKFCANVAALPLDRAGIFVRPGFSRRGNDTFSSMAAETSSCR